MRNGHLALLFTLRAAGRSSASTSMPLPCFAETTRDGIFARVDDSSVSAVGTRFVRRKSRSVATRLSSLNSCNSSLAEERPLHIKDDSPYSLINQTFQWTRQRRSTPANTEASHTAERMVAINRRLLLIEFVDSVDCLLAQRISRRTRRCAGAQSYGRNDPQTYPDND